MSLTFSTLLPAGSNSRSMGSRLKSRLRDAGLKNLAKLQELRELDLTQTNVTNAGVKYIGELKSLTVLHLQGTLVTAAGLKDLGGLKLKSWPLDKGSLTDQSLKDYLAMIGPRPRISIKGYGVTDAGLKELETLPRLKHLSLIGTSVSDKGLEKLAEFKQMRSLVISTGNATVTSEGLRKLQQALPWCEVKVSER